MSEVKEALSREKNPFYEHASIEMFLAYKDNKVVGRIAAIVDHNYIEVRKDNVGLFGFFECINDQDVASALFTRAEQSLKEVDMTLMMGPTSPSMNDEIGVLIDAFDIPPAIKMVWNPSYYPALYEQAGFKKAMDVFAWTMDEVEVSDKLKRLGYMILKRTKVSFRKPDMKNFDKEIKIFRELYNSAWSSNWGFVPWTENE
ncbi:MAG: GNAT family N-acetyltransferase, partial [Calditrichaeota bacterium]|nr:GNAT family N-acetyltransferase [Calditrichota bacterium]